MGGSNKKRKLPSTNKSVENGGRTMIATPHVVPEKTKKVVAAVQDNEEVSMTMKKKNQTKLPSTETNTVTTQQDNTNRKKPQAQHPPPQQMQQQQSMMTFETFVTPRNGPLSDGVLRYIKEQKFTYMTPVQIATIPQFLSHKDVAVQSVTGSGKTLAFVIPIVELLLQQQQQKHQKQQQSSSSFLKPQQIGALILSPTRELAQQTYTVAKGLCRCCQSQPEPLLLVGGGGGGGGSSSTSYSNNSSSSSSSNARPVTMDIATFQKLGSNIVIGTPGRVNDILSRFAIIDCSELICLVLDEADVLLNMGFTTTLQSIMSYLPKMRRTALFSATQSSSTSTTLSEWMQRVGMRNPIWIDVTIVSPNSTTTERNDILASNATSVNDDDNAATSTPTTNTSSKTSVSNKNKYQATPLSLQNYYIVTKMDEKLSRLATFLQDHAQEKIIVFFLTCACVDYYGTIFQQLFATPTTTTSKKNCKQRKALESKKNDHDNNSAAANHPIVVEMLHGKMVQKRREKTMERFRKSCNSIDDDSNSLNGGIALFCTDVAARGLDVSDIQWVVQVDAPQDPSFFIHRVGRCARANKIGQSLIFLTPKEESYIDFLHMRNIPIQPLPDTERCCPPTSISDVLPAAVNRIATKDDNTNETAVEHQRLIHSAVGDGKGSNSTGLIDDILPKIYNLVTTDRDVLEKGTKAFTSYIRAYKEHHCAFIFRFASLDLGLLATSFCLLRLPKMPELRDILQKHNGKLPNFTAAGREIDIFAIPYKDKAREQARQKRLQEELAVGGKNAKRIEAERRKAEKEQKDHDRRQKALEKGRNPDKKRGRQAQLVDEWEDLAKEERLVKKLRRGKMTKEEFNEQMNEV